MQVSNRMKLMLALAASMAVSGAAQAKGECPGNTVCAADPESIAGVMREEGYQAKIGKAKDGDPMIESGASGYSFTLYFYDCKENTACKSLQFLTVFEDDGTNTPELANSWNKQKRFVQMAADDKGTLSLSYDVTTVGGLTRENFADVVDWWAVMLSQVRQFFNEESASAAGPASVEDGNDT